MPEPANGATANPRTLLGWDFVQDPYAVYRGMRDDAPVHKVVVKTLTVELNAWVVTRYDDARRLLADRRLSKDGDQMPRIVERHKVGTERTDTPVVRNMLFSDPPDHTRLRRIMGRAFTVRRVQTMRPWIERTVHELLDRVTPGAVTDVVRDIALTLPISVIGRLLGVPDDRHEDFRAWNGVLTSVTAGMAEKQAAFRAAGACIAALIKAKRADPGDDLIGALVEAGDGDEALDDDELLSTVFLVMNAGYETTASMISSSVHALLVDPGAQRALRADPALVPAAVEEFLRWESPLNLATARFTVAPVLVGDVVIPEDELVFISLAAANRDPGRFTAPDRLDPARPANAHVSFGHGIHHCVGAPLARLEGEVVLRALLDRFGSWELARPAADLVWRNSLQFRALDALPVRFHRV
ncbi:cytochrome P450 family protein [Saccharothrix syringae]|uniref:Cytochrome P450 n=1 Tax=Saccharothrix syringae TaxID=103733 RepID=A0A5Q0H1Q1_SACSY|nr:cytochrome P450 [Saccharothrix syringae]QFZ20138.1 cytochrome P450 [Saccharothrix syringae]